MNRETEATGHSPLPERIRILHLEDNVRDADLIREMIEDAGLRVTTDRVDTYEDFMEALERGGYDLILSDYSLPSYDGGSALEAARTKCPDSPFIFVSGTIGEETAVEALLSGATDYLLKTHLTRLGPAVIRALREAEQQRLEKRLHEALAQSEAKYRQIVEATEEGIWRTDEEGRTLFVNPRMTTLLGYSYAELVGRKPIEFVAPVDRETAERRLELHAQGRREVFEARFARKDGSELWAMTATTPLMDSGRRVGGLLMVTDITEKRRLEGQFLQAQKMEAVGRLAGGVAHDFNNLLTVILTNCQFVLDALGAEHPSYEDVAQIDDAASRAAVLTRQLLSFSRKEAFEIKVLDPNQAIRSMEGLVRRLVGENIHTEIDLSGGAGRIHGDAGHLEQVVMNLAVNARDAMPTGGRLTLRTEAVDLDDATASRHPQGKAGAYFVLTVADTGVGMDAETLAHLFEPFFTTKEVGKGTGLGLSTVYEIMNRLSGAIEVKSEVGRGSTFRLWFPRVPQSGADSPTESTSEGNGRGSESILVVDDEEILLRLVSRVLTRFGYSVKTASNAAEALGILQEGETSFDLVVTDVMLPGPSGVDLGREVEKLSPHTRILYISGYADSILSEKGAIPEGIHFMNKPFTPTQLLKKVRGILDKGARKK